MDFYAFHGCYAEEQATGNHFRVWLRLRYDAGKAARSDNMDDALNYVEACYTVQREMAIPARLLEHVAARILQALFRQFPQLLEVEVKVAKLHPPIAVCIDHVSVKMTQRR